MTILDFTEEEIKSLNYEFPLWESYELQPGTYPTQEETINTVASPNILIVREDVPEKIVYDMIISYTIFSGTSSLTMSMFGLATVFIVSS